jgi:O-antigen ligase
MLLPLIGLVAVLAFRQPLGIQAGPPRVIVILLAAIFTLVLAIRYPAAFIAPVLFLPRLKQAAVLSGMGPAASWTTLGLACSLLGAGIVVRLLRRAAPPPDGSPHTADLDAEHAGTANVPALRSGSGNNAVKTFLLFAAVVAISYTYTISPHYGSDKLIRFLLLGGGLFFAAPLLFGSRRDLRDFTVGTVLFGMVVAASSLRFSATGAMAAGANPAHIGKGQVIALAMLLLIYAPITQRRLRAFIVLVCLPWLALGLVAAVTRGPLFSLLLVLLLSCFVPSMRTPLISRRQLILAVVALVGVMILLSTFWFYGAEGARFRSKEVEIFSLLEHNSEAHGTAVERLDYYHAAWQAWMQRPLFGWGVGAWSMYYYHQDVRRYPHNLFFEVLMEEGLTGITALLLFLGAVFRRLRAREREISAVYPALLPCLIYLVSISMFSDDLVGDRYLWFWCGLALAGSELARRVWIASRRKQATREDSTRSPQPLVNVL